MQLQQMDMDKVMLLCGDDIYYQEHQFSMLPIFRVKQQNKYDLIYTLG